MNRAHALQSSARRARLRVAATIANICIPVDTLCDLLSTEREHSSWCVTPDTRNALLWAHSCGSPVRQRPGAGALPLDIPFPSKDNTPAGQNRCSVWQPSSWRRRSQQHRSLVERLIPLPSCMSWLSSSDSGFPHPLRKTSRGNLQALRWIGRPSPRRKLLRSRTGFQEPRESALRRCYSNRATINCGLGDLVNSRAFIAADRILNIKSSQRVN
ncbi:hypothetical protein FB009_12738 [Sinorhizobium medicae]|nr:hypothetical protein FB009_12738 [Sinorhizobium medicae]